MKNIGAERQLSEYNHVYKENTAIYRDLSVRMGMTESTFWILYTLRVEEAPVTQSDMCAILGYPKQTVNSALKKLEQEGLLTLSGGRGRGGAWGRADRGDVRVRQELLVGHSPARAFGRCGCGGRFWLARCGGRAVRDAGAAQGALAGFLSERKNA